MKVFYFILFFRKKTFKNKNKVKHHNIDYDGLIIINLEIPLGQNRSLQL